MAVQPGETQRISRSQLSQQVLDDLEPTPRADRVINAPPPKLPEISSTPYVMADDTTTLNNLPTDGTTVVSGDMGYTRFGSKVRQVNQKTGETTWHEIGADGNAHKMQTSPMSMQMQEAMNAGYSPNAGTATSWDDAIARQKADRDGEIRNRLLQRSEFLNKSVAERKKMRAQRDFDAADAARLALEQLDAGNGTIRRHTKTGKQYRVVKINGSTIDRITQGSAKMGRRSSLSDIRAYVQVDKDGNPVGEPKFYMTVNQNKGDGAADTKTMVPLDIARVMGQWAKSHSGAFGTSEEDAQRAAVDAFRFNGQKLNPMKWNIPVTDEEKRNELKEQLRVQAQAQAQARGRTSSGDEEEALMKKLALKQAWLKQNIDLKQAWLKQNIDRLSEEQRKKYQASIDADVEQLFAPPKKDGGEGGGTQGGDPLSGDAGKGGAPGSGGKGGAPAPQPQGQATPTPEEITAEKERHRGAMKKARGTPGGRAPVVTAEGKLKMPTGEEIPKNGEYKDPGTGKVYKWVGPGIRNFQFLRDDSANGGTNGADKGEGQTAGGEDSEADNLEKLILDAGGSWEEDDDGKRTVTIGNWDYLSPEVKERVGERFGETDSRDLDLAEIKKLQEQANAAKADFDARRKAEGERFKASLKGRSLTPRRVEVLTDNHLKEWDVDNDPRRMKSKATQRAEMNTALSLSI